MGHLGYLVATFGAQAAAQLIVASGGESVLPIGGFDGQDAVPTLAGFEKLVDDGALRYVLISGSAGGTTRGGGFGSAGGPSGTGGAGSTAAHQRTAPAEHQARRTAPANRPRRAHRSARGCSRTAPPLPTAR